jgi:hypothetical protein
MLSVLLSKLIASLLVASVCSAIFTMLISQTIMNSHYLDGQLTKVNGYNRLSTALSDEIGEESGLSSVPQAATIIHSILTPAVLRQKINSALDQLQRYYEGKGPVPVINLSNLASQAQAAGVPISQDSGVLKPITLGNNANTTQVQKAAKTFAGVRTTTIITSLLLLVALLAICWRRHNYIAVPGVLISIGVLMGLLALIFYLGSNLANHYLTFSTTSNAFISLGHDLTISVFHDLARRFGIIAAVCLVIGISVRIWVKKLQAKTTFSSRQLKVLLKGW